MRELLSPNGPVQDWSGAWVRVAQAGRHEVDPSDAVASFLARYGGVRYLFQPIVEIRSASLVLHAVECLVRGPQGTPYDDPTDLFEFFRCRGHLAELDAHCLEGGLIAARELPFPGAVVINVEATSVAADGFEKRLLDLLGAAGLETTRFILDVRIGYEEAPVGRLAAGLVRLRASGIRTCLDETRASASPIELLELGTPDFLKLSRSTVRNLWRAPWTRECVEGTVNLGTRLGFRVVAQGVESSRDFEAVRRCGVDLAQGSHVGSPVPAGDFGADGTPPQR